MNTLDTNTATTKREPIVPGKFPGTYAKFQTSAFGDLFCFGLPKQLAHKVALDFGSDIGNAMQRADADDLRTKVSKANKDGDSTIALTGKGKTKLTNSMAVVRVAQHLRVLAKEGLIQSPNSSMLATVKWGGTDEDSGYSIADYIADCEQWVAEQEWQASPAKK